jgi:drug/metabolite transporter superfamily protein YnfA
VNFFLVPKRKNTRVGERIYMLVCTLAHFVHNATSGRVYSVLWFAYPFLFGGTPSYWPLRCLCSMWPGFLSIFTFLEELYYTDCSVLLCQGPLRSLPWQSTSQSVHIFFVPKRKNTSRGVEKICRCVRLLALLANATSGRVYSVLWAVYPFQALIILRLTEF